MTADAPFAFVDAPTDRPDGGSGTRQDTAPVTATDCPSGSRSLRGQPLLSCFLRWVFWNSGMKTSNAENYGKGPGRQLNFDTVQRPVRASDIVFYQGVRRGLLRARDFTVPDSVLWRMYSEQIDDAAADIETLTIVYHHQVPLWTRIMDWLALPVFAFRQCPLAATLSLAFLLAVAFLFALASGWL